ncbi:MAG: hypothetical protein NW218_02190 [Saprospiraceae bacterium]|nr:hypothetical protein [Saprospiraceae bacterium]
MIDKGQLEEESIQPNGREDAGNQSEKKGVVYYDAYDHGFTNGILKIPKAHFEQFIAYNEKKNLANKELGLTLHALDNQKQLLSDTKVKLLDLKNQITKNDHALNYIVSQQQVVEDQMAEAKIKKVYLEQKIDKITIEYNWFNTFLFIGIGFLFIASDFFITFDVLHHGLDLELHVAGILALAVSSITFVIKPTIDRIFEKPNLDGKKRKQNILLITVSILAISVLACLGFFREKYFSENQGKSAFELSIREKRDAIEDKKAELTSCSNRKDNNCVSKLKAEISTLEQEKLIIENQKRTLETNIRSHGILFYIFIVCNVLFGVAGAICLSIAFPVLDRLILKRSLKKSVKELDNKDAKYRTDFEALRSQEKLCKEAKENAQNEIELLPNLEVVENNCIELQHKANDLNKLVSENQSLAEIALYSEAYERGVICEFNDKIIFTPNQIGTIIKRGTNNIQQRGPRAPKDSNVLGPNEQITKDNGYLHQQIRNLIEYNYQNKKHALNGEDV